ncbi:hypothetical protein FGO68_gene17168 [Halteria grandinella]|uniref:Uncharacterized protein n=1 Tax=Halteria grandinella TaxID=5974 RepID=A0A8J8T7H0_HALGN|nr:hypothetical protein FGO68_gene17168 [Halteria grandinella]
MSSNGRATRITNLKLQSNMQSHPNERYLNRDFPIDKAKSFQLRRTHQLMSQAIQDQSYITCLQLPCQKMMNIEMKVFSN